VNDAQQAASDPPAKPTAPDRGDSSHESPDAETTVDGTAP
jgi:hypothetical protein